MTMDEAIVLRMNRIPLSIDKFINDTAGELEKVSKISLSSNTAEYKVPDDTDLEEIEYPNKKMNNYISTEDNLKEEELEKQVFKVVEREGFQLKSVFITTIISTIAFSFSIFDIINWLHTGKALFYVVIDIPIALSSFGVIGSTLLSLKNIDK